MFLSSGLNWCFGVLSLSPIVRPLACLQKLSRQATIAARSIEAEEARQAELAAAGMDPATLAEEELAKRINMRYAKAQSMANKLWTETYRHATPSRADPVTAQAMKAMHDEFEQVCFF